MGAGIASVSAQAGIDVILIDRDQESADKGKAGIQKSLTDQVNKGRMQSAARDAVLARITATADYGALKGVDLIVEAVFEDRKVKAEATAKAQAVVPDVIFGSNTSTLPITSLAETAKDPAKFIGVHFFSPVERMMLVELLRQPLRAELHPGRPSDAAGGHSPGDDRERRAHGRHAGRPAFAQ
jgi:3-hydroxyacyl-CoA dehydrogenase/enoyl-CoA hydratase/3-hydroxybutyryl-CoA epimerase